IFSFSLDIGPIGPINKRANVIPVIFARSVSLPLKSQAVVTLQSRSRAERRAEPVQQIAEPLRVFGRSAVQSESPDLHGDQSRFQQLALPRIYLQQVHERQVAAELLIAANALIVAQEISATIEDQSLAVDLDGFHMMRRVAVNDRDAFVNQPMSEADLLIGDVIPPVAAPVD